jgi:hypothetical protein
LRRSHPLTVRLLWIASQYSNGDVEAIGLEAARRVSVCREDNRPMKAGETLRWKLQG